MREHPLVPTIRKGLVCLTAIALSTWSLEASFVVFAAGFGWWPGCGCCVAACDCFPSYYSVVIAGMADAGCTACENMNATYVCDDLFDVPNCNYRMTPADSGPDPTPCPGTVFSGSGMSVLGNGSGGAALLSIAGGGTCFYEWRTSTTPCASWSGEVFTLFSDAAVNCAPFATPTRYCAGAGSTASVTFVP